jgi:hypothetical protein
MREDDQDYCIGRAYFSERNWFPQSRQFRDTLREQKERVLDALAVQFLAMAMARSTST